MTANEILNTLKARKTGVLFIDFDSRSAILATDDGGKRDDRGILTGDVRDVSFNEAIIARTDPALAVIWSRPAIGNRHDGRSADQECLSAT